MDDRSRSAIILIGMAGSGKSTIGPVLARSLGLEFVDTDDLLEQWAGVPLQNILDREGAAGFMQLEEELLLRMEPGKQVIATGGSAVYSDRGMAHLKRNGLAVYLKIDLATLQDRLADYSGRGLVHADGQGLVELYRERLPLYKRHADVTVSCGGLTVQQICRRIIKACASYLDHNDTQPNVPGLSPEQEG